MTKCYACKLSLRSRQSGEWTEFYCPKCGRVLRMVRRVKGGKK